MTAQKPDAAPAPDAPAAAEALSAGFRAALWRHPREAPPYWQRAKLEWLRGYDLARDVTKRPD